jgi:hypothetical protein
MTLDILDHTDLLCEKLHNLSARRLVSPDQLHDVALMLEMYLEVCHITAHSDAAPKMPLRLIKLHANSQLGCRRL